MPEKGMRTRWDPREAGSQGGYSSVSQSMREEASCQT